MIHLSHRSSSTGSYLKFHNDEPNNKYFILRFFLLSDDAGDRPELDPVDFDSDEEMSNSDSDNEDEELIHIPRTRSQTRVSRSRSNTPDLTTPG